MEHQLGLATHHCRVCGSHRVRVVYPRVDDVRLPDGVAPIAGGAAGVVRWQCRSCRAAWRLRAPAVEFTMWRRRRPLASWMFV